MVVTQRTVIYEGDDSGSVTAWTTALSQRECTVCRPRSSHELSDLLTRSPRAVVVLGEDVLRGDGRLLEVIHRQAPGAAVLMMSSTLGEFAQQALERGVKDILHLAQDPTWVMVNRVLQYLPPLPVPTDVNAVEPPIKTVPLPELYSVSGRLSAAAIASYLDVPLKELAEQGLGVKYSTVHKTPDAEALQGKLRDFARVLELLHKYVGDASQTRAWLRRPHPDLSDTPPLQVMLLGRATTVRALLEDALNGYPS